MSFESYEDLLYQRNKLKGFDVRKQPDPKTCAASCLYMVADFLGANYSTDIEAIQEEMVFGLGKYPRLASFSKMALEGKLGAGLDTRFVYFDEGTEEEYGDSLPEMLSDYRDSLKTLENEADVERSDFTILDILEDIKEGRVPIVGLDIGGEIAHTVIVRGYDSRSIHLIDPLSGYRTKFVGRLDSKIDMPLKNYVSFKR